jgi:hypothetical protein
MCKIFFNRSRGRFRGDVTGEGEPNWWDAGLARTLMSFIFVVKLINVSSGQPVAVDAL